MNPRLLHTELRDRALTPARTPLIVIVMLAALVALALLPGGGTRAARRCRQPSDNRPRPRRLGRTRRMG